MLTLRNKSRLIALSEKLDLGESYGGPSIAGSVASSKYYPSIYISRPKPIDFPETGEATVKYRVASESSSKNRDGKETFSKSIEILSIEPVTKERLKKFCSKLESIELADPRPRNGMGQYAPQGNEGAPDPNTMAAAYGSVLPRKQERRRLILTKMQRGEMIVPEQEPIQRV